MTKASKSLWSRTFKPVSAPSAVLSVLIVIGLAVLATTTGSIASSSTTEALRDQPNISNMVNPKTLLFNAAFLPQFVPSGGNATMRLAVVSGVYLTVLLLGDMLWALSAGTARQLLEKHAAARNKITGGFLVAAAIGLALSRRSY